MRSKKGITAIEILVVVFLLIVLAAIVLPNLIGGQDKAREATVKANMRTAQIAVEAYARDNDGVYPATVEDLKPYYPYGDNTKGGKAGQVPPNPFSNSTDWPVSGDIKDIDAIRVSSPDLLGLPGTIEYTFINRSGCSSYAIRGAGKTGKALDGINPGSTLVYGPQ